MHINDEKYLTTQILPCKWGTQNLNTLKNFLNDMPIKTHKII
jgi:hypothetical protein